MTETTFDATNTTRFFYYGPWEDTCVTLETTSEGACPEGHAIDIIHHLGENDEHYCPTGFVQCANCGAVGNEPEPCRCQRWGK